MFRYLPFYCCLFLIPILSIGHAQTTIDHTIESRVFGDQRTFYVYLPEMYTTYAPADSVVVTYLLDGHYVALRDMVNNSINYLSQNAEILSTICVGIHHKDRSGELSPTEDPDDNKLALHLEQEVFPFIERNYRTKPFRIAIGHSRGGMYLIDALCSGNELFNAYIAISPSLGYRDQMIHKKAEKLLAQKGAPRAFAYSSVGGQETSYFPSNNKMDTIFSKVNDNDLKWHYQIYPNRSHWGTVVSTLNDGLISLKQLLSLEEHEVEEIAKISKGEVVKNLKAFYTNASNWSGLAIHPTANDMNELAYMLLNKGQLKDSEDVIDWAIQTDPKNPNVLDSKGEIIEKQGRQIEAHQYYVKALQLLEQEKERIPHERYLELKNIFTANIERTKS